MPNLIIIGIQKCGTSALHYYLDLHPEIGMSSPKELNAFRGEVDRSSLRAADHALVENLRAVVTPVADYSSYFDPGFPVRGEASPAYLAPWYPESPARIAAALERPRLIALVRDPMKQIPSSWQQSRSLGLEQRSLDDAIGVGGAYLERIRFRRVFEPYLQHFPREDLLVLDQADLLHRRRETLKRAFGFLGVDGEFYDPRMERMRHVSAQKGRGKRILDRLQRSPLAAPAYRLPQEAKWRIERLFADRSERMATPTLGVASGDLVREELGADVAWLMSEFGIDTDQWLR